MKKRGRDKTPKPQNPKTPKPLIYEKYKCYNQN
jgi:hypothetical protein